MKSSISCILSAASTPSQRSALTIYDFRTYMGRHYEQIAHCDPMEQAIIITAQDKLGKPFIDLRLQRLGEDVAIPPMPIAVAKSFGVVALLNKIKDAGAPIALSHAYCRPPHDLRIVLALTDAVIVPVYSPKINYR